MLESYVTKTRDKAAALSFIKRAMKRYGRPQTLVADGLRSYPAAMNEIGNLGRQEVGRPGRVAGGHELDEAAGWGRCVRWRRVSVRLTAPDAVHPH